MRIRIINCCAVCSRASYCALSPVTATGSGRLQGTDRESSRNTGHYSRVVTDSNEVVERLSLKRINVLCPLLADVNAHCGDNTDSLRVNFRGRHPRTGYVNVIAGKMTQGTFRHLRECLLHSTVRKTIVSDLKFNKNLSNSRRLRVYEEALVVRRQRSVLTTHTLVVMKPISDVTYPQYINQTAQRYNLPFVCCWVL
jgi:hypothetical protein